MTKPQDLGFDELAIDALTELVNIGVSHAALSLRELVGEEVILTVPSLAICSRTDAAALLNQGKSDLLVAIRQAFEGSFTGRALLIFPEMNSLEIVRAVAGQHFSLEDLVEVEQEALAEIGNIVLNSFMATIANLLQRNLSMSLPEVVRCTGTELFGLPPAAFDDVALFIRINFSIKDRQIGGYVAMVMDLLSVAALKSLIDEFIRRAAQ
jgi:chemotaxis protein CheC